MTVKFGTSGVRGLATSLVGKTAQLYIAGFVQHLLSKGDVRRGGALCLGWDFRDSSLALVADVEAVTSHFGLRVVRCSTVPTPALCYYAMGLGMASIMVTGSHIPGDRNGLKFYLPTGEITKADEQAIVSFAQNPPVADGRYTASSRHEYAQTLCEVQFIKRYGKAFGTRTLQGLKIGIYQHSTVARDLLVTVLQNAGAEVSALERSEVFVPIDTEAVSANTHILLKQWSAQSRFDAIVSADGDGDRPLLANHVGQVVPGDVMGLMTAIYLDAHTIVTPITSNSKLETAFGQKVHRSLVGSPFVIAEMQKAIADGQHAVVGFEANGGFLTASNFTVNGDEIQALPTRDCFLPLLASLALAKSRGLDLAKLVQSFNLPVTRADRLQNFPTEVAQELIAHLQSSGQNLAQFFESWGPIEASNMLDGLRISFSSGSVIHFRPSGNAPEFRCYVEAKTAEQADALLSWGMARLLSYAETGGLLL